MELSLEPELFEQAFCAHHAVLFPAFVSFVNRVQKEGGGAPRALEAASEKVGRTHVLARTGAAHIVANKGKLLEILFEARGEFAGCAVIRLFVTPG